MLIVSGWFATAKSQNGYIGETWSKSPIQRSIKPS
jgi:hypothetical protein